MRKGRAETHMQKPEGRKGVTSLRNRKKAGGALRGWPRPRTGHAEPWRPERQPWLLLGLHWEPGTTSSWGVAGLGRVK